MLSEGRIVEFDSPDRLLNDTSSTFYQLAAQAGVYESSQSWKNILVVELFCTLHVAQQMWFKRHIVTHCYETFISLFFMILLSW